MWCSVQRMILSIAIVGAVRTSVTKAFRPLQRHAAQATFLVGSLRATGKVGTVPTSFDDGQRPYQITTPIYYVNDKPHIGHAYTSTGKLMVLCSLIRTCLLGDSWFFA